jgi:hypothetical protein
LNLLPKTAGEQYEREHDLFTKSMTERMQKRKMAFWFIFKQVEKKCYALKKKFDRFSKNFNSKFLLLPGLSTPKIKYILSKRNRV